MSYTKFIRKTTIISDLDTVRSEFNDIVLGCGWGHTNQIGLNHRPGASNVWHDAAGSLYDYDKNQYIASETDYNQWHISEDSYLYGQIQKLSQLENINIGRARFMKLLPKTGLSVHHDNEYRYHLVIETNPRSFIAENVAEDAIAMGNDVLPTAVCYHLPCDSTWYKVDTTRVHWVYNGGKKDRIHLVVCGLPK